LPLRSDTPSLYRTHPRVQAREALRGADIAPLAAMHLTAHLTRGDGAIQERQQRKLAGGAAVEEFRAVHADAGVCVAIGLAADDQIALEAEVTAWMMRRVGDQHETGVRAARQREQMPDDQRLAAHADEGLR